eukprot:1820914-Prymnesium_polylepis.1
MGSVGRVEVAPLRSSCGSFHSDSPDFESELSPSSASCSCHSRHTATAPRRLSPTHPPAASAPTDRHSWPV